MTGRKFKENLQRGSIAIILLLVAIAFIYPLSVYLNLPNESEFNKDTDKSVFANKPSEKLSEKIASTIPKHFASILCSNCYPYHADSSNCRDQEVYQVSRWIESSQRNTSQEPQIIYLGKMLILERMVSLRYSQTAIDRLFFTTATRLTESNDVNETCNALFNKACASISKSEASQLGIWMFAGSTNSQLPNLEIRKSNCSAE